MKHVLTSVAPRRKEISKLLFILEAHFRLIISQISLYNVSWVNKAMFNNQCYISSCIFWTIYLISSLPNNRRQNLEFAWELTKLECWCLVEAPFLSRSFWQEVCGHEEGPRGQPPCRPSLQLQELKKSWRRPTAILHRSCQFVLEVQLVEFLGNEFYAKICAYNTHCLTAMYSNDLCSNVLSVLCKLVLRIHG